MLTVPGLYLFCYRFGALPEVFVTVRGSRPFSKRAETNSQALLNSPLKKLGCYRLVKNDEMQGAQIMRNEAYIEYVAVTRDEAQRRGSRFSPAC